MTTNWESYEEVGEYLLNQFREKVGLQSVEGKQIVLGDETGTQWEIDGKGVKDNDSGFVVIEFRRYTKSKLNQESMASLAFRIQDTGASGGIIVSPLGLQAGAKRVADAKNIIPIQIDPDSTKKDYFIKFLNELMLGVTERVCIAESIQFEFKRNCIVCGKVFTTENNDKICSNCL